MLNPARRTLLALGAFGALAVGGSAFAGAATNTTTTPSSSSSASSSSSSSTRPDRPKQEQLTGASAGKVTAAALDEEPGATVLRVESGGHGGSAYHAHVRKSDGTEVEVLVNEQFEVTAVKEMRHP